MTSGVRLKKSRVCPVMVGMENEIVTTRELLQFFQIDLDDSPLVVFGGATSVNSN